MEIVRDIILNSRRARKLAAKTTHARAPPFLVGETNTETTVFLKKMKIVGVVWPGGKVEGIIERITEMLLETF